MDYDQKYMSLAYKQALKAYDQAEIPIGAVIVDDQGQIVARGYNQVEKKQSQICHAEMLALLKATKKIKNWRLNSLSMYVTVQPCMMCLGALYVSRISRVVYGVHSLKYGFSVQEIALHKSIYPNLSTVLEYQEHQQAKVLMQMFFQKKKE